MRRAIGCLSGLFATAILLGLGPVAVAADSPITSTGQNLPPLTAGGSYQAGPGPARAIREYRASGHWSEDIQRVADDAAGFLDSWLSQCAPTACRPAVVFDIDETLLSSYRTFSRADFAPSSSARARAQSTCQQRPIAAVIDLYHLTRERGAAAFIITGRSDRARRATITCLRRSGVTDWAALVMRSSADRHITAAQYKAAARASIEASGSTIVFSIGDQFSDVAGGHFAHGYVLPNPMSFIP